MTEVFDAIYTACNLINKNTNTQYICVFINNKNINALTKRVGTRLTPTVCMQ